MGLFRKKKEKVLMAFATGQVVALKDVKDAMFSAGLMGQGIAIESVDGKFYSPVNGTCMMVFPTKHALGIKSETGEELLLHIGVDTVELKGKGFSTSLKQGQLLTCGDLLIDADLPLLQSKGYCTTAILCITEPKEIDVSFTANQAVNATKDVVATIKR